MKDSWANSEAYERYVGRWSSRVGEQFLEWLDAHTDARWLDIGCGTGALTARIVASKTPHLIGVEPPDAFFAAAKDYVLGDNVEFHCGSAEGLSVEAAVNLDLSARGQDEGVRVPICRPKPLDWTSHAQN